MTNKIKEDVQFIEKIIFRKLTRVYSNALGLNLVVADVDRPSGENELGYTSSAATNKMAVLHVNARHPMLDKATAIERQTVVTGVAAHEGLHQYFTDFATFEKTLKRIKDEEKQIFQIITNILEDTAIEMFAPEVVGGIYLKALRFSIAYIYKSSPLISEAKTPFGQYINAMIQFGDMGIVKGDFTFPEAKKAFAETVELFDKGINCPDGKERIIIAKEIFEKLRWLWEPELKQQQAIQELMEQLGQNGKQQMNGRGSGNNAQGNSNSSSKKNARRKITIEKISKEEAEKKAQNGEAQKCDGGELPDGDITLYVTDEPSENGGGKPINLGDAEVEYKDSTSKEGKDEENKSSSKKETDKKDGDDTDDTTSGDKTDGKEGDSDNDTEGKDTNNSDGETEGENNSDNDKDCENNQNQNGQFVKEAGFEKGKKITNLETPADFVDSDEPNTVGEITEDEYTISAEDIDRIERENENARRDYEIEQVKEAKEYEIRDFNIESHKLGHRTCLNYRVRYSDSEAIRLENEYATLIEELKPGINSLTNQLGKIFANDVEDKCYKGSGRISQKRLNSGRATPKLFTKRVDPHNKSSFAVCLVVDESGSMGWGGKTLAARKACIALAEIFANLNIPIYVMGFTADTMNYDIVHNHYIAWKNTHRERLKLLNLSSRSCNCDGYSIRYATKMLETSKAENKLLIVLSDGQPAARNYYDGVGDTRLAVKEARQKANVLGVAIGNDDIEAIHSIYERDFMQIANVDELFIGLASKIKKLIKDY